MRPNTCGSEEGTGSPGTEVTKSCELPYTCWEEPRFSVRAPRVEFLTVFCVVFRKVLKCVQKIALKPIRKVYLMQT